MQVAAQSGHSNVDVGYAKNIHSAKPSPDCQRNVPYLRPAGLASAA
jgi:hypothetical protein